MGPDTKRRIIVIAAVVCVFFWAYKSNQKKTNAPASESAIAAEVLAGPESLAKSNQASVASPNRKCGDATMAFVMSQNFVKGSLKSPSTAKFPMITESKSVGIGGCRYLVVSHVDAQNDYGAIVRQNYSAEMEYLPGTQKWKALDMSIK